MDALSERNPREATAEVLDGAVKLLRAELELLGSYARSVAKRAGFSIAFAWLAITFVQLALVLIVLSPVLVGVRPWHAVLWTILLALALAIAAAGGTVWALRSMRATLEVKHPSDDDSTRVQE